MATLLILPLFPKPLHKSLLLRPNSSPVNFRSVKCRAVDRSPEPNAVYRGVYGPWKVESSDVQEVVLYRSGLVTAAASFLAVASTAFLHSSDWPNVFLSRKMLGVMNRKTNVALDVIKKNDVSAAIFAPGWVYETKQLPDFQAAQSRWWGLVEKSWGTVQKYPKVLPFYSNFDQGHGYHIYNDGEQVSDTPWNNISSQAFQCLKASSEKSVRYDERVLM